MPVTYVLDPDGAFIDTRCTGKVTLDEVLQHFRDLERDGSLPDRLDVLLDLDEMESLPESRQLQSVVGEVERLRANVTWGACAIVASRDALFGMGRVFQVFSEGRFSVSQVFRDRGAAARWLESVCAGSGG